ncbi:glycerophosphodiester phosphodiesterase [Tenuibacillus multivorans]|uniref:Glycerophosphoryl diester phosphodiesterase n=1 Tax=Tenuibacillus multivorans TaxID=237069 RepID=A0A1H0CP20_9BACI|nr:glycerophosphodiester phosphodiesterase [Tenuibacillus multivorans]GEL76224.1 glycerophosphoryl diester phosphodiesterase [Tenuibacillus multivorans]SDN59575.1 glycerophosphoryl diester phosphodiesterase [Tenuibacillus multivorans]
MKTKKRTNKEKLIRRGSFTLAILGAIYILLNLIPIHSIDVKPFHENDRPLVIAHQGGGHLAPSSSMVAFQNAVDLDVDVLETDIHISKDGYLVAIHDPTVDRTTDSSGSVNDLTLDELKQLDAGYYFEDEAGNFPFRNQNIKLITVEELFQAFPNQRFLIEIKDTNPYDRMDEIAKRLAQLIEDHHVEDQVTVASFDHKIIETFQQYASNEIAISGGEQEVRKFVITHKFHLRNLYKPNVDSMQLPLKASGFDLASSDILGGAERLGLQIHYWTINDKETIRTLIEKGADGIVTDRPDLMIKVLEEIGY